MGKKLPTEITVTTLVPTKSFYPYFHKGLLCCAVQEAEGEPWSVCCTCSAWCGCDFCKPVVVKGRGPH